MLKYVTTHSSRLGITMGTCKTRAIQADLGVLTHFNIFRHNQSYSGIIQAYSGKLTILCKPGMFRILVYWEAEAYSEPCQTFSMVIFVNNYYFCNISLANLATQPHYEVHNDFWVEIVQNTALNIRLVRLSLREWPKVGYGTAK